MQTFKLKPERFKEVRKKIIAWQLAVLPVAAAAVVLIVAHNQPDKFQGTGIGSWWSVIILMVVGGSIGIFRGIKRQKATFDSYTLIIADNLITREAANVPPISIYFHDIREIAHYKSGAFSIRGKTATDLITIPRQVENYEQLEAALQAIQPLQIKDKVSFFIKYQYLAVFATIGLTLFFYTAENKITVFLSGSALAALMTWSFIKIRKNKNIDNRLKRITRFILIILVSIIAVMYAKLTGLK